MVISQQKDTFLILVVAGALAVEVGFLLHQMRVIEVPFLRSEVRQVEAIGKVVVRQKELKQRSADSLSWFPLAEGDPIGQNSLVMTGEDSTATLQLESSGALDLTPDTLIQFSEKKGLENAPGVSLEIRQGTAKVGAGPKPLQLRLRGQSLEVKKDSEIVVEATPTRSTTRIEVKKGSVSIGTEKEAIKKGEAVELNAKRELARSIVPLKFEAIFPAPNEILALEKGQNQLPVDFKWEGDSGVGLELSKDAAFKTGVLKIGRTQSLPFGVYYWRLREGEQTSAPSPFSIRPWVSLALLGPSQRKKLNVEKTHTLRWQAPSVVSGFTVQISRSEDFGAILLERKVSGTGFPLPRMNPGVYFWRVRAEHPRYGEWPFSEARRFELKKYLAPPKPKGVKLLPERRSQAPRPSWFERIAELLIPSAYAAEQKAVLQFQWEKVPGAVSYILEISDAPAFTKVVERVKVDALGVEVEVAASRQYYWRVTGVDADGAPGVPSRIEKVSPKAMILARELKIKREALRKKKALALEEKKQREQALKLETAKNLDWALLEKEPLFISIGAGWGGAYFIQKGSQTSGSVLQQGLPMGRLSLVVQADRRSNLWEARGWYQNLSLIRQNAELSSTQSDLSYSQWGVLALVRSKLRVLGTSLRLGAQVEQIATFTRSSNLNVSLDPKIALSALAALDYQVELASGFHWANDIVVGVSPVGKVRGVHLSWRNEFTHDALGFRLGETYWLPRWEVTLEPSFRWLGEAAVETLSLDARFGFYFVGSFTS